jgi:hypothetical protein
MIVENLIKRLQKLDKSKNIIVGCDEELNRIFENVHIDETNEDGYVLYPDEQTESHI